MWKNMSSFHSIKSLSQKDSEESAIILKNNNWRKGHMYQETQKILAMRPIYVFI